MESRQNRTIASDYYIRHLYVTDVLAYRQLFHRCECLIAIGRASNDPVLCDVGERYVEKVKLPQLPPCNKNTSSEKYPGKLKR